MNIRTKAGPQRCAGLMAALPLLGFSLLWVYGAAAMAGPASPVPFTITQPDGPQIVAKLQGDERNNWVETQSGYTIAQDQDGVWHYVSGFAVPDASAAADPGGSTVRAPVLSAVPAQDAPPAGLPQHLRATIAPPTATADPGPAAAPSPLPLGVGTGGFESPRVLLILASFNNQTGTFGQPLWATGFMDGLIDYYYRASYGAVGLLPALEDDSALGGGAAANNGVIGWINISGRLQQWEQMLDLSDQTGNHPSPGDAPERVQFTRLIAKAAMQSAAPYIDYARYDHDGDGQVTADELAVVIVVAGYEASANGPAPNVWGQATDLIPALDGGPLVLNNKTLGVGVPRAGLGPLETTAGFTVVGETFPADAGRPVQGTIGLTVHNLGHQVFGLPDLYDVNTFMCPDGLPSGGVGAWSLMGVGCWGARPGEIAGATPVLLDAWSKLQLGWVLPLIRERAVLTGAGEAVATGANTVVKVPIVGTATEYFLIENRQNQGYDQGLQASIAGFTGGLAIWHIDDAIACRNHDCNSRVTNEV